LLSDCWEKACILNSSPDLLSKGLKQLCRIIYLDDLLLDDGNNPAQAFANMICCQITGNNPLNAFVI